MESQNANAYELIEDAVDPWSVQPSEPLVNPTAHNQVATPTSIALQQYCRSRTFIARTGVNPLAAAASALFSLIAKLRLTPVYDNIEQLRHDLIHEIKAFESTALGRRYNAEQIVVARYVICATLDETILRTPWGMTSVWQEYSLVAAFQEDGETGERVFSLLEDLRAQPSSYVDLLEFFYLCLSLGFEGKYRAQNNGRQELDSILDDLYRIIRRERGDVTKPLLAFSPPPLPDLTKKSANHPFKRIAMVSALLLSTVYASFLWMLHMQMKPVYSLMTTLTPY